jgi:hypothetical protein
MAPTTSLLRAALDSLFSSAKTVAPLVTIADKLFPKAYVRGVVFGSFLALAVSQVQAHQGALREVADCAATVVNGGHCGTKVPAKPSKKRHKQSAQRLRSSERCASQAKTVLGTAHSNLCAPTSERATCAGSAPELDAPIGAIVPPVSSVPQQSTIAIDSDSDDERQQRDATPER